MHKHRVLDSTVDPEVSDKIYNADPPTDSRGRIAKLLFRLSETTAQPDEPPPLGDRSSPGYPLPQILTPSTPEHPIVYTNQKSSRKASSTNPEGNVMGFLEKYADRTTSITVSSLRTGVGYPQEDAITVAGQDMVSSPTVTR